MPIEKNKELKDAIYQNWRKTGNQKVLSFLRDHFWRKLDAMGDLSGHWMEQLEARYKSLSGQPQGLMRDWDPQDFEDLHFSLFGYNKRKQ